MKISLKKVRLTILITLILIIGLFSFAFHRMAIEDQYGDLQEFYFKSKSGDLMIFGEYEKIGVVDKTWKRVRLINSKKDTVDLYTWIYDDRFPNGSNTLYRMKEKITFEKMSKELIRQKVENNEFKRVMSITKTEIN